MDFVSCFLGVDSAGSCSTRSFQHQLLQCTPGFLSAQQLRCSQLLQHQASAHAHWPEYSVASCFSLTSAGSLLWSASSEKPLHAFISLRQVHRKNLQRVLPVHQHSDCSTTQGDKAISFPIESEFQPGRWAFPWVLNLTLELWLLFISAMPKFLRVLSTSY